MVDSSRRICFVDTETTGLQVERHEIWEVALITPDDAEHVWQFTVDEIDADPFALDIGHYWQRRWQSVSETIEEHDAIYRADVSSKRGLAIRPTPRWCRYFRDLTARSHLCGAVPSFDEERLRRLLRRNGVLHRWHHHLIDVEALGVGWLFGRGNPLFPPWNSEELSRAVGVEPDDFDRHTALGDARWARAIYRSVTEALTLVTSETRIDP